MKKSNVIITVVVAVVSVFLLWLWYYLGLNQVDEPLDLVLSVVWWVVIAVGAFAVVKLEQKRRRQIRTLFVADGSYFNSEAGTRFVPEGQTVIQAMAGTLAGLRYDFFKAYEPDLKNENNPVEFQWIVRTAEYKAGKDSDRQQEGAGSASSPEQPSRPEGERWQGEVVKVKTGDVSKFSSRDELEAIIG